MARSALSIAQAAAALAGGLTPTSLVGSTDRTAIRFLTVLRHTADELTRMTNTDGGSWSVLEREHSFETVAGQEAYTLPADFTRALQSTLWTPSAYRSARGSLSPSAWRLRRSDYYRNRTAWRYDYRIRQDGLTHQMLLDPVPEDVQPFIFEYVSGAWLQSSAGVRQTDVLDDSDVPVLPTDILELGSLYRYLESRGEDYGTVLARYELARDKQFGLDNEAETIYLGADGAGFYSGYETVPGVTLARPSV